MYVELTDNIRLRHRTPSLEISTSLMCLNESYKLEITMIHPNLTSKLPNLYFLGRLNSSELPSFYLTIVDTGDIRFSFICLIDSQDDSQISKNISESINVI